MNPQSRGPSALWYLLPVVLALASAAFVPFAIWKTVTGKADVAVQFKAPGECEVVIPRPGTYTLWLETKTIYAGTTYESNSNLPPGMKFELIKLGMNTNSAVPFVPESGSSTMIVGSVECESVGAFDVGTPGRYRLSINGQFPEKIFYFRESYWRQFRGIVQSGAIMFAGWVSAAGMALFIFLRRRAAHHAL